MKRFFIIEDYVEFQVTRLGIHKHKNKIEQQDLIENQENIIQLIEDVSLQKHEHKTQQQVLSEKQENTIITIKDESVSQSKDCDDFSKSLSINLKILQASFDLTIGGFIQSLETSPKFSMDLFSIEQLEAVRSIPVKNRSLLVDANVGITTISRENSLSMLNLYGLLKDLREIGK